MIIVTGANGFIGSALVWQLNQKGFADIVAVDSVDLATRPDLLKFLRYREFWTHNELLSQLSSPQAVSLAQNVSAIYHMGACSSTTETNWNFLRENNLEYSQILFRWCADHQIPFVYASSASVYGDGAQGYDDTLDTATYTPLQYYGRSKLEMDVFALKVKRKPAHWYGLRFFNVYGPNEYHKGDQASVAFKAFHQIQATKILRLFKSENPNYEHGKQMRDFVYIKDITRWMFEILERGLEGKWPKSGIYNLGFGTAHTWLDLAQAAFKTLDRPVQIEWLELPQNLKGKYQYFTEAKMEKWKAQGLSSPQWSLEAGIHDYLTNYLMKANPYLKVEKGRSPSAQVQF